MKTSVITPDIAPGTEYGDKCAVLAEFLHDLVFGPGQWAGNEEHYKQMYREDAVATITLLPHLLGLGERERLQEHIPALALGFIGDVPQKMPSPARMGTIKETAPDTEYGETLAALAEFLHAIPNGEGTWSDAEASYRTNYTADAADVLAAQPHLIDLEERRRLATIIPGLAP